MCQIVILPPLMDLMTSIINIHSLPWIAMDKSEILSITARRNMFLSPDALEIIMSNSDPVAFTYTVLSSLANNPMFITKDDVVKCLEGDMRVVQSPKTFAPHNKANSEIKVVDGTDITGNSTCVGDIDDFFRYFQSRYNILKKIIVSRRDFDGSPLKIKDAMEITERDTRIVGIIDDRRFTMNGHMMLTVEDDGGDKTDDVYGKSCAGRKIAGEQVAELVDHKRDHISETTLIANSKPGPTSVVHFTTYCTDRRKAGSAKQVEYEE